VVKTHRRDGPSAEVRIRVYKRDRFRCTYCGVAGTDAELEVDHIVPVAGGGSHHISNLTTACRACNQKKGSRTVEQFTSDKAVDFFEYQPLLQCGLDAVVAYLKSHKVELWLPEGECCDMDGAIKYASLIDPQVALINTYSGGINDTYYIKEPSGWCSVAAQKEAA
jgi:hypothetical protein